MTATAFLPDRVAVPRPHQQYHAEVLWRFGATHHLLNDLVRRHPRVRPQQRGRCRRDAQAPGRRALRYNVLPRGALQCPAPARSSCSFTAPCGSMYVSCTCVCAVERCQCRRPRPAVKLVLEQLPRTVGAMGVPQTSLCEVRGILIPGCPLQGHPRIKSLAEKDI